MRLPDDRENDRGTGLPLSTMIFATSLVVLAILGVVLYTNRTPKRRAGAETQTTESMAADAQGASEASLSAAADGGETGDTAQTDISGFSSAAGQTGMGSGRTAADLDFWDMYPKGAKEAEDKEEPPAPSESETEENDPSTDGKHTRIIAPDGKEEWLLINPYLKKNTYDFTKLASQNDIMKYYENGRQVSFVGVNLSEYNGDVDFFSLTRNNFDFCMLRVGVRGYESGQILPDKRLEEYLERAGEAGMQIGLYFSSQAVSEEEAIEEAAYVLSFAEQYEIIYPIAFCMEQAENTASRIDGLSKSDRTKIAAAFCETVKAAGYAPMIYGDKYWLLKMLDISRLTEYDVWYTELNDLPDYPYQFAMWQYSSTATVSGVPGLADLNICFINYGER